MPGEENRGGGGANDEPREPHEPHGPGEPDDLLMGDSDDDTADDGPGENDKRRDKRVSYDLPVFFYVATGKRRPREVAYQKGYTQDVSRNGIKLLIERPTPEQGISVGTELELEIYLPAVFRSKPLTGRGVVVRAEPDDHDPENVLAGIDFVNLDDKSREALKKVARTLRKVTDDILGTDE